MERQMDKDRVEDMKEPIGIDPYYTKRPLAVQCVSWILEQLPSAQEWLWVEPSAGDGAFLESLLSISSCERVAMDIAPRAPDIIEQDYLSWKPPVDRECIVFGNPPFDRQGSLARAFIKHSSFARAIAFILPLSNKLYRST